LASTVPLAAYSSRAFGINDSGQIVGDYRYRNVTDTTRGFLDNGGSYTTLNDPFASGGTTRAFGINDQGQIVGDYVDVNGVQHGFLATPVREWQDFECGRLPHQGFEILD
jgi:probable HAF family extracellular repeat protein